MAIEKDPSAGPTAERRAPGRRAGDHGRYGRLSRELVLTAALGLVDREGLSALSMRRTGAELGVEAMALYRYAAGKDALLDGLVEALYAELEEELAASEESPEWRDELHRIAAATYRVALAHPQVAPLLATRMLAVPLARRPLAVLRDHERVLALLNRAGLDEEATAAAFRAVNDWILGCILGDLRAMVDNPDEPDPAFRLGLHRMPARELPRLRAAAPALARRAGPEGMAVGLDALLDRFAPGAGATE
ncbi:TetR/AcrR family transcriptional regulator [Streptomyces aureus]|uniref:TetR/AcrR family transcriptional regulator n=1 Tax=Streptomyces aureus TaxID=193461 RepID=UPI0006E19068|nr:TetR/AcrR family transcriptional regulator C-terminal domain-containing protein [Streptomyces aureus]